MKTVKEYAYLLLAGLCLVSVGWAQVTVTKERGGYLVKSSEKFEVASGGDLKMEDLWGDVHVEGGNYVQAEVIQEYYFDVESESDARKAFEEYRAQIKKLGNRLVVSGGSPLAPEAFGESHRLFILRLPRLHGDMNASYQVLLPAGFNADVNTTGGDVDVSHLKGRVEVETSGGDVEMADIVGSVTGKTAGGDVTARATEGSVNLSTAGGDVNLSEARTGPYVLKTAGGDITATSLKGDVRASTSGGDVEVRGVEGELDLRTSGGDIILEDVKGRDHRASTSGGDVEARIVVGDVDLHTSGGLVRAVTITGRVIGNTSGGDMDISEITGDADVSTSGGDLFLKDVRGRLVGETSGGDIRARVQRSGKLAGPIVLSTSGGEIELRLPKDVQASVQARIRVEDSFGDYSIRSDFKGLKIVNEVEEGRHRLRNEIITATGDINGGGPLIELDTVNGDIIITSGN